MIAQPAKADWKNMYIKSFYASSYTAKTKIEGVNFGEPKEAQIENLGGQVDLGSNCAAQPTTTIFFLGSCLLILLSM